MREAADAAAAAAAAADESLAPGISEEGASGPEGRFTGGESDLAEHTDSGEREIAEEAAVTESEAVLERMFSGDIIMMTREELKRVEVVGQKKKKKKLGKSHQVKVMEEDTQSSSLSEKGRVCEWQYSLDHQRLWAVWPDCRS